MIWQGRPHRFSLADPHRSKREFLEHVAVAYALFSASCLDRLNKCVTRKYETERKLTFQGSALTLVLFTCIVGIESVVCNAKISTKIEMKSIPPVRETARTLAL